MELTNVSIRFNYKELKQALIDYVAKTYVDSDGDLFNGIAEFEVVEIFVNSFPDDFIEVMFERKMEEHDSGCGTWHGVVAEGA